MKHKDYLYRAMVEDEIIREGKKKGFDWWFWILLAITIVVVITTKWV